MNPKALIYVCAGIVVGIPVGAFLQYRKRTIDKILVLEVELDVFTIKADAIPDGVTPALTNGIWWMLDGVE